MTYLTEPDPKVVKARAMKVDDAVCVRMAMVHPEKLTCDDTRARLEQAERRAKWLRDHPEPPPRPKPRRRRNRRKCPANPF